MNNSGIKDTNLAIMPLDTTKKEVFGIFEFIKNFNFDEVLAEASAYINVEMTRHVLLIGSGDSYALALLYSAILNNICSIPVRAIQSYEFISERTDYLDGSWLVIVLSASGRVSPVLDTLRKALLSNAQVLGITNTKSSTFAKTADQLLVTHASKKGMPTQSTLAMALFLDVVACLLQPTYEATYREQLKKIILYTAFQPSISRLKWGGELLSHLFSKRITLLGSGGDLGLATLFSNLLWCGPQLSSQALHLEEFEHSLRLDQTSPGDLIIIFNCTGIKGILADNIIRRLSKRNSVVILINNKLLSLIFTGNEKTFPIQENCHCYAMLLIFNLIISATEKYLLCGNKRVALEQ